MQQKNIVAGGEQTKQLATTLSMMSEVTRLDKNTFYPYPELGVRTGEYTWLPMSREER